MEGAVNEANLGNEPLSKNKVKYSSTEDARIAETNNDGTTNFPTMNPKGQLEYTSVHNSQKEENKVMSGTGGIEGSLRIKKASQEATPPKDQNFEGGQVELNTPTLGIKNNIST